LNLDRDAFFGRHDAYIAAHDIANRLQQRFRYEWQFKNFQSAQTHEFSHGGDRRAFMDEYDPGNAGAQILDLLGNTDRRAAVFSRCDDDKRRPGSTDTAYQFIGITVYVWGKTFEPKQRGQGLC